MEKSVVLEGAHVMEGHEDALYVLVDKVRDREGCAVFWRPTKYGGYTIFLSRAGLFTAQEARRLRVTHGGFDAVPFAVAEAASVRVVPDGVLKGKVSTPDSA